MCYAFRLVIVVVLFFILKKIKIHYFFFKKANKKTFKNTKFKINFPMVGIRDCPANFGLY